MKEKKVLITIVSCILVIILDISISVILVRNYDKKVFNEKTSDIKAELGKVTNAKEYTGDFSDFYLKITGITNTYITKTILNDYNIKPYEFDVGLDTDFGKVSGHLIGYKMKDVMGIFNDNIKYSTITVSDNRRVSISYSKNQLDNDNLYLIVYTGNEQNISFLDISDSYNNSLDFVYSMRIN